MPGRGHLGLIGYGLEPARPFNVLSVCGDLEISKRPACPPIVEIVTPQKFIQLRASSETSQDHRSNDKNVTVQNRAAGRRPVTVKTSCVNAIEPV